MPKRSTDTNYEMNIKRAEGLAIGSPIFVRVVGSILCAITLWVGKTTYELSQAQAIQNTTLITLNTRVESLINNQFTKGEAEKESREIRTKMVDMETRIRSLEDKNNQSGGLNDPVYVLIQTLREDINKLKIQVEALSEEVKKKK